MNQRRLLIAGAAAAALAAAFLPTGWYDTIPRAPNMVLPFSGATLLRLTFVVEAVVLAMAAIVNPQFASITNGTRSLIPARKDFPNDLSRNVALLFLAAITVLGVYLRVHRIGQDLWLDEISPIFDYMKLSPAQVMGSYLRSNNHLLNTLLEKISIGAFGEHEWSARLPAVIFGVSTIPLMYWVARIGLSRFASLGSALALAASYHHVFFSQNARGYTAYIFFALLSTALLISALRNDRLWRWALYVTAIVAGSASHLLTAFVIAAHVLLCAVVAAGLRHDRSALVHFVRRVVVVLAIAGFIAFQIYSAALPEVYVVINTIYAEPATGYPPFSAEFVQEMVRGVSAGFGSPVIAGMFLLLGAAGLAALFLLSWPLAAGLFMPPVITAMSLAIRNLTFSPRFFLLLLPLATLSAMALLQLIARRTSPKVVFALGSLVVAFALGRSLPYYYRTPKQPYRSAISVADARYGRGRILVISTAELGTKYYTRGLPPVVRDRYVYTRSLTELDSLAASDSPDPPQAITTFSRALKLEVPDIAARLSHDWEPDTTFAATVGDGEITIWSKRK